MKKPLKPLPTDCCGSGCNRCIFEIYDDQLKQYTEWLENNGIEKEEGRESISTK